MIEREYVEYGGEQYPLDAMYDRLDRVRQKLGEGKGAPLLTRAPVPKENAARANGVSEVQDLGRVQQRKALSYTPPLTHPGYQH